MSQPPMPPGPPTEPLPQPQSQTWPLLGTRTPISRAAVPEPKKAKRFGWPIVIVTAVVALSLGGIVGGVVGGSGNGTATTAEPNPTVAVSQINDGIHEVGVDVKAGQYKTSVPEGAFCYWERSRGDPISDSTSSYKEGPAHLSVTLKKGESFDTEDCGTWQKV
jgi:hypothetical protein